MAPVVGVLFGLGMFLIVDGVRTGPTRSARPKCAPHVPARLADLIARAGLDVSPGSLVGTSVVSAAVVGAGTLGVSHVPAISLAFAGFASYAPFALVRGRVRRRTVELREAWPDLVDDLASSVRAGLALPEAVGALARHSQADLSRRFRRFEADYNASGRFGDALDLLKAELADPVGDRIVETLRLAREVGGTDLGRLLQTLSVFLREDARTRAELEARQGWTVNGARLAVAAPWVVLALLSTRPAAVDAYRSTSGAVVLGIGAAVSWVAYRLMLRVARLPVEPRLLA